MEDRLRRILSGALDYGNKELYVRRVRKGFSEELKQNWHFIILSESLPTASNFHTPHGDKVILPFLDSNHSFGDDEDDDSVQRAPKHAKTYSTTGNPQIIISINPGTDTFSRPFWEYFSWN